MSGLVVGYGQPNREDVEAMFERIGHRGPALSGLSQRRRAILAQNYGPGDLGRDGEGAGVPVLSSHGQGMRICYDGQMGNWEKLFAARDLLGIKTLFYGRQEQPLIRSKEELYYFRIFTGHFGADGAVETVGQWVSL